MAEPRFPVVSFRGYDRDAVDAATDSNKAIITQLQSQLAEVCQPLSGGHDHPDDPPAYGAPAPHTPHLAPYVSDAPDPPRPASSRPRFPIAAYRGYDRDAVDAATAHDEATIAQLQSRLAQVRAAVAGVHRYDDPPSHGTPPSLPDPPSIHDEPTGAPGPGQWDEVRTRAVTMAFDGRVLEVFGDLAVNDEHQASVRLHVAHLLIETTSLGGGSHDVGLWTKDCDGHYGSAFGVWARRGKNTYHQVSPRFDSDEWAVVDPFLSRVADAGAQLRRS
ncbi:MAG: hypothetical protein FWF21_10470 [Micrococcales bacterium]|nr:hypothetical protein [Micrococcales bacterium]